MAKYRSLFEVQGKLGEYVFYTVRKSKRMRHKGTLDKKRFEKDPCFKNSRAINTEFVSIAKDVGLFRAATREVWFGASDNDFTPRLTKTFWRMMASDAENKLGKRSLRTSIIKGNSKQMFIGFDFNIKARLSAILLCQYELDAECGSVALKGFVPKKHLKYPRAATHVKLQCAFSTIDLVNKEYETSISEELLLSLKAKAGDHAIVPGRKRKIAGCNFVFLRIVFLQEVNGVMHELEDRSYNCSAVIG